MTLYLSYNVDVKSEVIVAYGWSNTDIPVLALVTNKKRITFFQDEAICISEHDIVKEEQMTCISWHPVDMILAYGFETSKIGIWIDEENYSNDENTSHEGRITLLKFNNDGTRIVSVDEKNSLIIWKFEGGITKLCQYKQNFLVEEIFFPNFDTNHITE